MAPYGGNPPEAWPARRSSWSPYGAHCVYVTDSGGHMTMGRDCGSGCGAYRDVLDDATEDRGSTAHQNLSLAGRQLCRGGRGRAPPPGSDGLARRYGGPGPANCPLEPLVAGGHACRAGDHRCDPLSPSWDAADDLARPLQDRPRPGLTGETLNPRPTPGVYLQLPPPTPRPPPRSMAPTPGIFLVEGRAAAGWWEARRDMIADVALDHRELGISAGPF